VVANLERLDLLRGSQPQVDSMTNLHRSHRTEPETPIGSEQESQFSAMPEALLAVSDDHDDSMDSLDQNLKARLREGLGSFAESLNDVLVDVTALEVNTILVDEIKGYKFIPEEAYQKIYFCLDSKGEIPKYLHRRLKQDMDELEELREHVHRDRIPPSFRRNCTSEEFLEKISKVDDEESEETHPEKRQGYRNWQLREKLTKEYCQIFFQEIFGENGTQNPGTWGSNLPYPYELGGNRRAEDLCFSWKTRDILKNARFLRSLRKVSELQAANNRNDKIYAQTVIQLDGDIINRYRQELFKNQEQSLDLKLLVEIHNQGVTAGEVQWRGLLEFCIKVIRSIVTSSGDRF
jgi:hypothetical protein